VDDVLPSLLVEELPNLRVTRSRFASFTGRLGLTVGSPGLV
jgi:hypothetical protein